MKNLITLLSIIMIFTGCISSKNKTKKEVSRLKIPSGVDNDFFIGFMNRYLEKDGDYHFKSEISKTIAQDYFQHNNYKIIMKGFFDEDEEIDFLVVEPYPGIYKGVKKGLVLSDKGKIILYIDRKKGFYTPEYPVYDFQKIGYGNQEVACIRLLFRYEDINIDKKEYNRYMTDPSRNHMIYGVGSPSFQIIDQNLNIVTHRSDENAPYMDNMINQYIDGESGRVYYVLETGTESMEWQYEFEQKSLLKFRDNRLKGITYKAINFDPENIPKEMYK